MDKSVRKEIFNVLTVILASVISAFGLHVFVYPSDFAPSGIDGISTVLQELTGFNAGIFNFVINLPLLIAAWFILNRRYVFYTVIYTLMTSWLLLLLSALGAYQYVSEGTPILPAVFGGVTQGLTSLTLRVGGSAGGIDVIACMIQKKQSHRNIEGIISVLSYITVAISYFVYGNLGSVLLSVTEIFVCEKVSAYVLRSSRSAVEFRIITDEPDAVCRDIFSDVHKTATVIDGYGAFSGKERWVVVCVVNYRQIPTMLSLVGKHAGCFAYYSDVTGIRGAFDWGLDGESNMEKPPKH